MRTAPLAAALLCSSIALTATIALAQDRPIVAVFRIEDKSESLDKKTLDQLTDYLGAAIAEGGVFRRVPPGDLVKALTAQTTESYKECYDQSCQIEIGREVAATKSLSTRILKPGSTCAVTAELYDLKTKATDVTAKESGPCGVDGLMASLDKVAATLRAYGSTGKASGFQEGKLGGKTETWDVGSGEEVVVAFNASPEAALVMVDGRLLCQKTPCSKSVPSGAHQVSMQSERYQERSERVVVVKGFKLDWELKPAFGWLTVRSMPPGLPVSINGQPSGNTPLEKKELAPGGYEVLVGGPCHAEAGERVKVELGEVREVAVSPAAKEAGLEVKAKDGAGNDLEADVLVDGAKVGTTPGRFKVSVCAKEAEVRHAKEGSVKKDLSLEERKVTSLEVELKGGGTAGKEGSAKRTLSLREREVKSLEVELKGGGATGLAGFAWIFSRPAGIEFTRSEVTVSQYRACVKAGKCGAPISRGDCNWGQAGREAHPVNCVDWNQATMFCGWAGGRLPTEEEWEAEASAGGKRHYPWGEEEVNCERAIWRQEVPGCRKDGTWPVCSKPAGNSVSGLCDMSGNVWEWTSSSEGSARVLRGGSWLDDNPVKLRASYRYRGDPAYRGGGYGFRCGRSAKP